MKVHKRYDGSEYTEWEISDLVGMTMTSVERSLSDYDGEMLVFKTAEGRTFRLAHNQECCEDVVIESVVGDLADLVGEPMLMAEEVSHQDETPEGLKRPESIEEQDSFTWTFYKFATRKGYVDVRFYGTSNGCYSESAELEEVTQ